MTHPVDQAAKALAEFPSSINARSWLLAKAGEQRRAGTPDSAGRVSRLEILARDNLYCLCVAELQRATTALVNRRRALIGDGTT